MHAEQCNLYNNWLIAAAPKTKKAGNYKETCFTFNTL